MKRFTLSLLFLLFVANIYAQKTEIIQLQGNNTLLITNDTIVSIYNKYNKILADYIVDFIIITNKDCDMKVYSGVNYAIVYIPKVKIEIRTIQKVETYYTIN